MEAKGAIPGTVDTLLDTCPGVAQFKLGWEYQSGKPWIPDLPTRPEGMLPQDVSDEHGAIVRGLRNRYWQHIDVNGNVVGNGPNNTYPDEPIIYGDRTISGNRRVHDSMRSLLARGIIKHGTLVFDYGNEYATNTWRSFDHKIWFDLFRPEDFASDLMLIPRGPARANPLQK